MARGQAHPLEGPVRSAAPQSPSQAARVRAFASGYSRPGEALPRAAARRKSSRAEAASLPKTDPGSDSDWLPRPASPREGSAKCARAEAGRGSRQARSEQKCLGLGFGGLGPHSIDHALRSAVAGHGGSARSSWNTSCCQIEHTEPACPNRFGAARATPEYVGSRSFLA